MTEHAFDPLALWRDMLSKWETGLKGLPNKGTASQESSQLMDQALGQSVRMQHAMGEIMGRYLTAMNMPSRADLVAIGERLQGIEDQLARLRVLVERLSAGSSTVASAKPHAKPPRTKRPATAMNEPSPVPEAHASAPPAAAKPARRTKTAKRKAKGS